MDCLPLIRCKRSSLLVGRMSCPTFPFVFLRALLTSVPLLAVQNRQRGVTWTSTYLFHGGDVADEDAGRHGVSEARRRQAENRMAQVHHWLHPMAAAPFPPRK